MKELKDLLKEQQDLFDDHKYVTREFQDYGYRLAAKLNDLEHKALYIKLAKNEKRAHLEQALSFAIDYPNAKNRARIFMWKLKELKNGKEEKEEKKGKGENGASSEQDQKGG